MKRNKESQKRKKKKVDLGFHLMCHTTCANPSSCAKIEYVGIKKSAWESHNTYVLSLIHSFTRRLAVISDCVCDIHTYLSIIEAAVGQISN